MDGADNHNDSGSSFADQSLLPNFNPTNVDSLLGLQLGEGIVGGANSEDSASIVTKPHKKRPKVTAEMLTSKKGLPYIRANKKAILKNLTSSSRSRENLTNFLKFYQIWAHNLFPLANFGDFLEIVKRHGSSSVVKRLREEWILEDMSELDGGLSFAGMFETTRDEESRTNDEQQQNDIATSESRSSNGNEDNNNAGRNTNRSRLFIQDDEEEDEELYTTTEHAPGNAQTTTANDDTTNNEYNARATSTFTSNTNDDDSDDFHDDDDFDSLLNNLQSSSKSQPPQTAAAQQLTQANNRTDDVPDESDIPIADEFDGADLQDEFDIMNEMGL